MANKIKYGVCNAFYAKYDSDTKKWSTPVALPGAVSVSLSANGETTTFYADNIEYFKAAVNSGYEGSIELALVPESFRTDILGETLNTDKVLIESSEVVENHFALGFQLEGDSKASLFWFYNCTAERPEVAGNTKESSISVETETLNISCAPTADGIVRARTTEETTDSVRTAWFTAVYEAE